MSTPTTPATEPAPPITFSVSIGREFGVAWAKRSTLGISAINVRETIAVGPRLVFLEAVTGAGKRVGDSGFQILPEEMDVAAVEWLARRYPALAETLRAAVPDSTSQPVIDRE